jgi:hypothetical protein
LADQLFYAFTATFSAAGYKEVKHSIAKQPHSELNERALQEITDKANIAYQVEHILAKSAKICN